MLVAAAAQHQFDCCCVSMVNISAVGAPPSGGSVPTATRASGLRNEGKLIVGTPASLLTQIVRLSGTTISYSVACSIIRSNSLIAKSISAGGWVPLPSGLVANRSRSVWTTPNNYSLSGYSGATTRAAIEHFRPSAVRQLQPAASLQRVPQLVFAQNNIP